MNTMKKNNMKKKIAIFSTGWCCEILGQFLRGMMAELSEKEADLFLFLCYPIQVESENRRRGQFNIFNLPDLSDFDGVVIFSSSINFRETLDELFARCEKLHVPVIVQGMEHEHFYTLNSDNYHAMRSLCEHLLDKHDVEDMCFFAGPEGSYDSQIRLKAIRDVLEERGRSGILKDVYCTEWENARVEKYIREHIADGWKPPRAILCANDGLAMQACTTLAEYGYSVPEDIIITGFDHIDESQVFYPSISSIDQLFDNTGRICSGLWHDVISGRKREKDVLTPCEFIPGESCGCFDACNNDDIRRAAGRSAFITRSQTNYFSRKLNAIDNTILASGSYEDFRERLRVLYLDDHDYEGDSFHILFANEFGQSLYNTDIPMRTDGYSDRMDVICSMEDGVVYDKESFVTRGLVPGYTGTGPNHLYIFLPIHSKRRAYGYVVFRDHIDKVYNHVLQTYQDRFSMAVEKYRRSVRLNLLNEQLLELMNRDPLTNVNNRTAYETKTKELQAQIEMDEHAEFGIVMFDINNLKTVNDTLGHDAGDVYIIRCCRLICKVYSHSPVYRIGGDEFVAVLTGDDYRKRAALIARLKRRIAAVADQTPTDPGYVSVACGLAVFDRLADKAVEDVTKRADTEMYRNKREMKETGRKTDA